MDNEMKLEFKSKSSNEAFARIAVAAFASQLDPTLEELADIPIIIYRRWQNVIQAAFEARGLSPSVFCVNDDAGMTLDLALGGIGVGINPPSGLPKKLPQGMSALQIDSPALVSRIALVCNEKKQLPESAKMFWSLASE